MIHSPFEVDQFWTFGNDLTKCFTNGFLMEKLKNQLFRENETHFSYFVGFIFF